MQHDYRNFKIPRPAKKEFRQYFHFHHLILIKIFPLSLEELKNCQKIQQKTKNAIIEASKLRTQFKFTKKTSNFHKANQKADFF